MYKKFENGKEIKFKYDDEKATVESFLAEGGTGSVYKVNCRGKVMILKWFKFVNSRYYEIYYHNNHRFLTSPIDSRFLTPKNITEMTEEGFGVLMEMIDGEVYCNM